MKSKNTEYIRRVVLYVSMAIILFWLYSYLVAHAITDKTSTFYKVVEGAIIFCSLVNVILSKKWWQRLIWILVTLFFAAILAYWIGWDMNKFQF